MSKLYGIVDAYEHHTQATRGSNTRLTTILKTWNTAIRIVALERDGVVKVGKRGRPIKRYGRTQYTPYNRYEIYFEYRGRQTQPIIITEKDIQRLIERECETTHNNIVITLDDLAMIQDRDESLEKEIGSSFER